MYIFDDLEKKIASKILWTKEKMFVTSISSFSHVVFNTFREEFQEMSDICNLQNIL